MRKSRQMLNRFFTKLDRVGSAGALIAALAAPCCLPVFATFAAAIGLPLLTLNEQIVLSVLEGFALLSVLGLAFAGWRHRQFGPLLLGTTSAVALLVAFHARFSSSLVYTGLAGLCAASVWNYFIFRRRKSGPSAVTLISAITCPECGHRSEENMPTDACLFFYDCSKCGVRLKPKAGDCCVFCSYGSVKCPPMQAGRSLRHMLSDSFCRTFCCRC